MNDERIVGGEELDGAMEGGDESVYDGEVDSNPTMLMTSTPTLTPTMTPTM